MIKKTLKANNYPEKERFSNFVIDLRPNNKNLLVDDSKAKKKIKKKKGFYSKLSQINIASTSKLVKSPKKSAIKTNKFLKTKKTRFKRNSKNHWSQIIKERKKIFNSPVNYKKFSIHSSGIIKKLYLKLKPRHCPNWSKFWKQPLILFILILVIIVFILAILAGQPEQSLKSWQKQIDNYSRLGVAKLISAGNLATQFNFNQANTNFKAASLNFMAASHNLAEINSTLLSLGALSSNPQLKLASQGPKFLQAGYLTASLGSDLMSATNSLFVKNSDNLAQRLNKFLVYGQKAVLESKSLVKILFSINISAIPPKQRAEFISLQKQTKIMSQGLAEFISATKEFKSALGLVRNKRYLLVFQNNAEMRASGGFIGSYALVDLNQGKIVNLEVPAGGSYDTAGALKVKVIAPQPLWLLNPLWHFWDANWWPDWPTSARNLMWFYTRSGGPSVDGVISITPNVVVDLLKVTGPIKLPDYNLTINSHNFWSIVQTITEAPNLAKTNPSLVSNIPTSTPVINSNLPLKQNLNTNLGHKPKKIIGDLLVRLWQILPQRMNVSKFIQAASLLQKDLASKQILFYFQNPKLEQAVSKYNWGGQIKSTKGDYLMVVDTNIGGQKSDRVIKEEISQTSQVQADGTIIDTVRIKRIHQGHKHTPLTGVRNVDWLRVYVPLGSRLLSATGFKSPDLVYLQKRPQANWQSSPLLDKETAAVIDPNSGTRIYNEDAKTVFANWSLLDPGQSVTLTLTYQLPFNFFNSQSPKSWLQRILIWFHLENPKPLTYSLLVQKQPGAKNDAFNSKLLLPPHNHLLGKFLWSYPADIYDGNGWKIKGELDSDHYYVILLKSNTNSQ